MEEGTLLICYVVLVPRDFLCLSSSGSAPKRLRSTQGRRRRTSRFLGPAAGGLLDGLEARDANRLVSDDGYVHGYTFRMPQPNAERMLRTVDFSLPRDYTRWYTSHSLLRFSLLTTPLTKLCSLKLEMNRTREVLAASSSRADEEQDMGQEVASQSILDTSGGARKRKRRETSGEENIKAGEALRREQDALQEDFGTLVSLGHAKPSSPHRFYLLPVLYNNRTLETGASFPAPLPR